MTLRDPLGALSLLLLLLPAATPAAQPWLPLEDVVPGASAVARTVIQGTRIEEFGVEIVSVVHKVGPDRDLILARALGERMERLGVAQGMSGSPVYVDGKLVGAVAATWSFAKEPMFGITPVGQMDREAQWSFEHGSDGASTDGAAGVRFLDGRAPETTDKPGFRPIASPLVLSGFDGRVADFAGELFEPWGFTVTEGGAAGEQAGGAIEPGATIGVRLAGGDVSMTAFGTVTWVEDDRVHAWGHPFFQMGDVEMPLVGGFVHATIPSNSISFKLASGGDVVGTLTSDRASGISGRLGVNPRVTTFDLKVTQFGEAKSYHYEIARNRFLTPTLVGLTAANSVLARAGGVSDETVRFSQHIVLDDGRDTTVETFLSGDQTLPQIVGLLSQATQVIVKNPFERVDIDRIEAELTYEPGVRLGVLTDLSVDDDTPPPGESVRGTYTIRDFQGDEHSHRFAVPLPEDAREGRYLLLVSDARTAEQYEAERDPRSFAPRTLEEYLDRLRGLRQTDEIHVHLYRQSEGVLIDGRPLPDLPPSALSVIRGATRSGIEDTLPAEIVYEARIPAGRFVKGGHNVLLEVRKEKP